MSLTVYGAALSPFVRKLRVVLREKNLPYEHVHIDPAKKPDYFLQLSPLGRIPVLKDGDLVLADSGVICTYLDTKHPQTALRPTDPAALAQVLWFEKFADYELAPLMTFTVFRQRVLASLRGGQPDESAVATALNVKLPPLLDYLEKAIGNADYIAGNAFSVADIAIAVQVANLGYGGEKIDATRWPQLARYVAGIQQRPSLKPLIEEEVQLIEKIRGR
jgi:glutathione S-transferase